MNNGTHVTAGVRHCEDPRAAVCGERADCLGTAMVEETREGSFVRRGELAARAVPRELHRHLDVRIGRQARYTEGNAEISRETVMS